MEGNGVPFASAGRPVTLRDVSREAGVSLATADRVLNNRAGVRENTAERVRNASARLGYHANPFASRLARGGVHRLAFVLPRGSNPFMAALREQIGRVAAHLRSQRVVLDLMEFDPFDPASQAEALARLNEAGVHGVAVVAVDHPLVAAAIAALHGSGIPVVTLVSDAPGSCRTHYVGVDNLAAGRTAGTLLGRFAAGNGRGAVGVVLGSAALRDHADRLRGFQDVLDRSFPALRVLPALAGQDDDAASGAAAATLLHAHPDLVGLYAAGAGTPGIAAALRTAGREEVVLIGHELDPASRAFLRDGTVDALIHQDAGHEARSAARLLLAELTGEPILPDQERIRIEIFLRDNLP